MHSIKSITIEDSEIKKSRFIAILYPVKNEDDVLNYLTDAKLKYPNATHYCYAYILGDKQEIQKSSDDGEPQKTAGVPMLEVLKKQNMTFVLAVVVRYFGGIKLGAGGLVRAYSSSVKDAIKRAIITESALYQQCKVTVDYGSAGGLEFYLHSLTDNVEKIYGGDVITLRFVVLDKNTDKIGEMVKKLSNFQSHLVKEKEVIRYM